MNQPNQRTMPLPTPAQITADRLAGWQKKLAAQTATPLALVGLGVGANAGQLVLCIPENGPSDADIARVLHAVADQLAGGGQ